MQTEAPKQIKDVVEKTIAKIHQQVKSRGVRVSNVLRNAELEVLRGKRSGRKYRKPYSKRRYTASAPGEPPARRTGALRLSWTGGVDVVRSHTGSMQVTAYIESSMPYAGYLENGTDTMAARPYVDKIRGKAQPEIDRIMKEMYSE